MNSTAQLGKKLKEARLIKKMTQSDVAGTFITRNMLSQIESGAASPSLKTLEYLANTLELPIHYLISEPENGELSETQNTPQTGNTADSSVFLNCKAAYIRGDYGYVIGNAGELSDKDSPYYDEGAALLALSYLKAAKSAKSKGNPRANKSAITYARLAASSAEIGIYASREVRTEALLMLDELSEIVN